MRRGPREGERNFPSVPSRSHAPALHTSEQLRSALEFIKLKEKLFIDTVRVGGPGRSARPRDAPARRPGPVPAAPAPPAPPAPRRGRSPAARPRPSPAPLGYSP